MNKHRDKIIGLLISLVFIVLIFWKLDFKQLIETFRLFNYKVLLLFVPLYALSVWLRGARWKFILCNEDRLSVNNAFLAFTAGNTLNSYLPARAGDFWRAFHIGNQIGESKMKMLGSIILERLIDGISVLLILYFAVVSYFNHPWIIKIAAISGAVFAGALVFFFVVLKTNKIKEVFDWLSNLIKPLSGLFEKLSSGFQRFISGFEVLNNPKCFVLAFIMSMLAWVLECIVTYILITGFGHHFGFSIALFVISFVALSTVIPSSSVFVGPYQFAYIMALGIYHVDKSQALGIAFIHQITIMLVITFISIIYFTKGSLTIKNINSEIEEGVQDTENE